MSDNAWRRCSACKKPIALGATYYVCNVSTCNQKRTGLAFCDVSCWEVHLPIARHRKSWAEERTAPRTREVATEGAAAPPREARRIIPKSAPAAAGASGSRTSDVPLEVLVVASRLKEYVRQRSGYNTSDRVLEPLSDLLREIVDEAIRNARQEERRTVLDRDIPRRRGGSDR